MARAYQLVINGHGHTVVSSLSQAFRHFAASMASGHGQIDSVGSVDDFPALDDKGLAGSYAQRVRWEAENGRRYEDVEIVEHDTDAKPGYDTATFALDVVNDCDPSYLLQAALYKAETTETDLAMLGEELQIEAYDAILNGRRFGETDEAFLARLRRIEEWMGADSVIPEQGDPTEILTDLPKNLRLRFEELAAKAWPEEAAAPQV